MDHIQHLLAQTGWSCEDLMQKLSEFKQKSNSDSSVPGITHETFLSATTSNGYEVRKNGHQEELIENKPEVKDSSRENCDKHNNSEEININDKKCDDDCLDMEISDLVTNENIINKSLEPVRTSISIVDRLKNKLELSSLNGNEDSESLPNAKNTLSNNVQVTKKAIRENQKTFDHTYIRTKRKLRQDKDPTSPRNTSLRKISTVRKNCFFLRSRRRRRLLAKLNKFNRKLLIAQYKRPEMVRSEILKQLELLRSRKPNIEQRQTITNDKPFVNKKRYLPTKVKNGYFEPKASCSSSNVDFFEGTGIFEVPDDSLHIVKHDLIEENGVEIDSSIEMIDYNYEEEIGIKNIIIADVRGGCEILENSKTQEKEDTSTNVLSDSQDHMIKPTKTSDITKIKGWKTKKFDIADKADKVTNESSDSNPAFASSDLDGFLATACVDLNFKVPTVLPPPEQPIGRIFIPQTKQQDESEGDIQHLDSMTVYRPRKRIVKLKYDKGKRETMKPRTLAEKRRLLGSIVQKRVKHVAKPADDHIAFSYILYRGKRLKVRTKTQNEVIAHVKTTYGKRDYIYVPKKPRNLKAKPSIFKNTFSPMTPVLKYRPGPLCKKANLQFNNQNWSTVIKKLPKVTLGIVPQYKKPIDPKIVHLLPKYDFDITHDRVEFALTALKAKDKDTTVNLFEIKVPYQNNQEEIILRSKTEEVIPEIKIPEETSIDDTCRTVIGKMLDYLEIKEISDEVIKNDVNTQLLSEDKFECNQAVAATKKRKKQSKTNYELKRLNVKVIEVNLEEKEDIKDCKKDFCLLGCICNSLSTTSSLLANHCGRPDCMFECECNYQRKSKGNVKVTLPIGTDLLSEGAVNRLEVEAKKNLARVEKEFTQTVIQANNQTIVVGGCTNRQRRVTKLPKKYNDYIEDTEILVVDDEKIMEPPPEKPIIDVDNWEPRECSVCLQKLRLDQVIPFCLVHNLYDCHCKYKAEYPTPILQSKALRRESTDSTPGSQEVETIIITSQPGNITKEILKNSNVTKTADKVKITPYFTERSYFTDRFEVNYCARTRGIPTQYYMVRNRTERFISTRDRKFLRDISKVNVDVEQDTNSVEELNKNNRNKRRKQELVVKEDLSEVRVKRTPKRYRKKPPDEPKLKSVDAILKFLQLFPNARKDHNYFAPSPDITQKFFSLLARKEGTIFYLLQWQVLATGYQKNTIQLWYSTYFKVPKIVITDSTMLPKYFTNIKKYEKVSNKTQIKNDIIRALVTGTVPGGNSKDDMQVILELSQIYCQIHGTIKKNQDRQENLFLTTETHKSSPKIVKVESLSEAKDQPNSLDEALLTKENGNALVKPNLPIVRKIMFKKHIFLKQNLATVVKDDEATEPVKVSAHLPAIKDGCLWRMLKLNSDFNVLSLTRNCYSIKYSDIQKVLKMAVEKSMTIVLKTEVVSKNYPHKDFGIYVSPNVENAFFVGPYYELESHDISMFRYLNRELIRTEAFNKMKGLPPVTNGAWLKQCAEEDADDKGLTIDLTESDHEDSSVVQESLLTVHTEKLLFNLNDFDYFEFTADNYASNQSLVDDDVSTNVPTTSGNIYFLTNVATLGFVLGHKLTGDNVLVRWPTFNSVLKFKTYSNAVKYLQREMAATFIQAPGFNIAITISTENTGTIFNPNYLKGYYIVSESGLTNVLDVTKATLSQLKFTRQQLEDLVKQRACKLVYDNCYEVAKSLFSKQDLQLRGNTTGLVNMMQKEIKKLEQQNVEYLNTLESLSTSKTDVLGRFDKRCEELWPHVNDKFKSKLMEVLRSHGRKINIPEKPIQTDDIICIDIDDDDDEVPQPIEINSEPTHGLTIEKLPIYTKNPSMIITANINDRPAVEIVPKVLPSEPKVPPSEPKPKITIKSVKDLIAQQPVVNKMSVLNDQSPDAKSTIKARKYLLKTSTGAVIEIQADQYKKLRAQSSKAAKGHVAVRRKLVAIAPKEKDLIADQAVLTKLSPSKLRKFTLKQTAVPGGSFVKIVTPSKAADVSKSCSANTASDVDR